MSFFKKKEKTGEKKIEKTAKKAEVKTATKTAIRGEDVKSVLKQPWFSERATLLAKQNKYIFLVHENATKPAVREEVERRYGVHVTAVNVINISGKMKHYGRKTGRRSGIKKAIITLKTGDKIEIQ